MTTHNIAFYNKSTAVTDDAIRSLLLVLTTQLNRDFTPKWNVNATLVFVGAGTIAPSGAWPFEILDNTDDLRFYARHIFDGAPIGRVFAATDNLCGVNWQVCVSHELMEMLVDPQLNQFALGPNGAKYDKEVCDPVQDDSSAYNIGGTLVSNFVFPSWFDPNGAPPYDFCKQVAEAV